MIKASIASAVLLVACGQTPPPAPAAPTPAVAIASRQEPVPAASDGATDAPDSADAADRRVIAELEKALGLYRAFMARAGDDPSYAPAVIRSRERIADISDTLDFMRQGMNDRRR